MAGEVIHDDDGAIWKIGDQYLFDIGLEGIAVDGTIEHPGRDDAARGEGGNAPPIVHALETGSLPRNALAGETVLADGLRSPTTLDGIAFLAVIVLVLIWSGAHTDGLATSQIVSA